MSQSSSPSKELQAIIDQVKQTNIEIGSHKGSFISEGQLKRLQQVVDNHLEAEFLASEIKASSVQDVVKDLKEKRAEVSRQIRAQTYEVNKARGEDAVKANIELQALRSELAKIERSLK